MKHNYACPAHLSGRFSSKLLFALLLFITTAFAHQTAAQKLDPTFRPELYADNTVGEVRTTALQTNGKLLLGGNFMSVDGIKRTNIARLNADGSLDESFSAGETVNFTVNTIAIQPNGAILVGGALGKLLRLNPDGTVDASFKPQFVFDNITSNRVHTITLQADGKILVGGYFFNIAETLRVLVRLKPDGAIDETFSAELKRDIRVYNSQLSGVVTTLLLPDGKIVVAGSSLESTNTTGTGIKSNLMRLHPDGKLDQSFQANLNSMDHITHMALQSDGKVITLGTQLVRFNADGSKDTGFNPQVGKSLYSMALQPDGKVLVGQKHHDANNPELSKSSVVRLNPSGALDATFNPGMRLSHPVNSIALKADGSVYIGGDFARVEGSKEQGIALLKVDGTLDKSFHAGGGIGAKVRVYASAIQPDGKVVMVGDFHDVNGVGRAGLARLNPDGNLDESFNSFLPHAGIGYSAFSAQVVKLQKDGKILIGGGFHYYDDYERNGLARLHPDGSLDLDFNPVLASITSNTYAMEVQPDGKIIVGGFYNTGAGIKFLYRLNTDGTIDETFNTTKGPNNTITKLALQPDGKILISGAFASVGGIQIARFARLNSDGTLDMSFKPEMRPLLSESAMALQSDGKILLSGFLQSPDGFKEGLVARLNPDGSLDSYYSEGKGSVKAISVQPNGKILLSGNFNLTEEETDYYGLSRLNADFSLDEVFDNKARNVAPSYTLSLDFNGDAILGGWTDFNGTNRFTALQRVILPAAPTAIALSNSSLDEKNAVGAAIGTLASTDADEDETHTYTLVEGEGDTDNASFTIENSVLKAAVVFDYQAKSSYSIRIRSTDSGGEVFEAIQLITINKVQETVTGIADEKNPMLKVYPNPANSYLVISLDKAIDSVRLVNSMGGTVLTKQGGAAQIHLGLEQVASGVYTVLISSNGKLSSRRIVVVK